VIGIRVEFWPQVHLQNMLVGTDAAVELMSRKRMGRKDRGRNGRSIVSTVEGEGMRRVVVAVMVRESTNKFALRRRLKSEDCQDCLDLWYHIYAVTQDTVA